MGFFLLGLAVFFGAHLFTTLARGPRASLAEKVGEGGYKGLYSLISLAGFALIVIGWRSAPAEILYATPAFLRHVVFLLMLIAFILLAAAYLPAGKIAEKAKHPMLAGVKLWAFAHLLVNGEVRSVLLFGAFLVYAVIARIALKKRDAPIRQAGEPTNDLVALLVGAGMWASVFFVLHPVIAGVPLR